MRKKRTLLICAACALLALIALLAYTSTTAEPSHGGHPLNYWVLRLSGSNPFFSPGPDPTNPEHDKATNAINQIGVAALPFLLKWIQCEPPPWKASLSAWLGRTRLPLARKLANRVSDQKAYYLASKTYFAFDILGTRALPAFDNLCCLIKQTNAPFTARCAIGELSCLGPKALPPLVTIATNSQSPLRLQALGYIKTMPYFGEATEPAVPALIQLLSEASNPHIQQAAASALGHFRAAPQISIPALVASLKSPDLVLRATSAQALGAFGPQASNAIPDLANTLADPSGFVRGPAAMALHQIDPVTFPWSFVH